MGNELEPVVGNWYHHRDKGEDFEVVAVDEDQGLVEIQYFDGATDELDLEDWRELEIELREPPEDWTGPVDEVEPEALEAEMGDTAMAPEEWSRPADEMHPFTEPGEGPEASAAAEEDTEEAAGGEEELLDPRVLQETVELEGPGDEEAGESAGPGTPGP